jgi:hypothetical protein
MTLRTHLRLSEADRETLAAAGGGQLSAGTVNLCRLVRLMWSMCADPTIGPMATGPLRLVLDAAGVPQVPSDE